ncbi:MAG: hypothetical protein SGJ15_03075 [Bacteroidota bacterium]|nr:hypothetical protein [Bacteroidota bacterium]
MRSILKITLVLLAILAFTNTYQAQTKPKTTTKAPVKKTPVKKAIPKEINVYLCTSSKDKYYHKRSSCMGMNKCSEAIKNIKKPAELGKYKRKKCPRCKP